MYGNILIYESQFFLLPTNISTQICSLFESNLYFRKFSYSYKTAANFSKSFSWQVYEDETCKDIFNSWCSYTVQLLNCTMSINIASTQLGRHYVSLINDHKMTRMCFAFLKQIDVKCEFYFFFSNT